MKFLKLPKNIFIISFLILLLSLIGIGCQSVTPPQQATPTSNPQILPIPIAISPNVSQITPGEEVTVGVASDRWNSNELNWEISSLEEGATNLGSLSAATGTVIIYKAPEEGPIDITISVVGKSENAYGSGTITLRVEEEQTGGVITYWTIKESADWDYSQVEDFSLTFEDVEIIVLPISIDHFFRAFEAAVRSNEGPDVIRFPDEPNFLGLAPNNVFNSDFSTSLIREIGEEYFNPAKLEILSLTPGEKTWYGIPSERGNFALLANPRNDYLSKEWLQFLVKTEIENLQDVAEPELPGMIQEDNNTTMVLVKAGPFSMGADPEVGLSECKANHVGECSVNPFIPEQPVHEVYLDDFYIDQFEVTNQQYAVCVSEGVCSPPSSIHSWTRTDYYQDPIYSNYPVIYVSWENAITYCNWRDARLPTEAEWEKAARGTEGFLYPWGNDFEGTFLNFCDVNCDQYANPNYDDGYGDTAPVDSYPEGVSPYGAYNMVGNVWEWVNDWYASEYYENSSYTNPLGPTTGNYKVLRGGSWVGYPHTTTFRTAENSDDTFRSVGFRCASTP